MTQIAIPNLKRGRAYRFYIVAEAFNETGPSSPISTIFTCVVPSGLQAPTFVKTTSTTMSLVWIEPKNNGDCPLLGFALFRDDGLSTDTVIEVNQVNDPLIRNIHTLNAVDV